MVIFSVELVKVCKISSSKVREIDAICVRFTQTRTPESAVAGLGLPGAGASAALPRATSRPPLAGLLPSQRYGEVNLPSRRYGEVNRRPHEGRAA